MEESKSRLEMLLMKSPVPTTVVDLTKMQIKQTLLQPSYRRSAYQWQDTFLHRAEEDFSFFVTNGHKPPAEAPVKRMFALQRTEQEAPMVQTLIQEAFQLPDRCREAYVRQWRQALIKQAAALVKFVQDESSALLAHATTANDHQTSTSSSTSSSMTPSLSNDIVQRMMDALGIIHWDDFLLILTQADKMRPGMMEFVDSYSKRL
ncbi:hypothetical protein DM01DRAFT_261488 [Hesseltinella vesiculosa]|uniref:Uncharacterized protein n=1 Tax=Hesseltinella vesiculosa TaxID=101127 RepID=A0A1X2G2V9_9FUNG|nr:hypothetical protein DM01DRAFT_261488 [Hesseltinella vesiculosa]